MRLNVLSYNSTNVWERDGKRSRRPILATRCFCGLGRGDERGVAGGIGGTRTGGDRQGTKTGRRGGVSL